MVTSTPACVVLLLLLLLPPPRRCCLLLLLLLLLRRRRLSALNQGHVPLFISVMTTIPRFGSKENLAESHHGSSSSRVGFGIIELREEGKLDEPKRFAAFDLTDDDDDDIITAYYYPRCRDDARSGQVCDKLPTTFWIATSADVAGSGGESSAVFCARSIGQIIIFCRLAHHRCVSTMDSAPAHVVSTSPQIGIGVHLQRAFHGGLGISGSVIVKSVRTTLLEFMRHNAHSKFHSVLFKFFPLQLHPNGPAFQSHAIDVGDSVMEVDGTFLHVPQRRLRAARHLLWTSFLHRRCLRCFCGRSGSSWLCR